MNLRILEDAQQEMEDAVDYYNRECPGLGYEFADEVYRTFDLTELKQILRLGTRSRQEPAGALHTGSLTE